MTKKADIKDIKTILAAEAAAVLAVPIDNPYEEVIRMMHRTHAHHGKVVVTGVGKAGDVGRKIVSTFNSIGITSIFLSPLDARHGDLGVIGPRDMLFLISNSGRTTEITELVHLARKIHPKIPAICLTGNPASPLARLSDHTLDTGCRKEICPLGLTPTTSAITMLVIADILTVLSMKERGYSTVEYQLRHHGGYLGKKARRLAR